MPIVLNGVHSTSASMPASRPYNVLVTGFGPFSRYPVNPSWLAPTHDDPRVPPPTSIFDPTPTIREVRITTLSIPVTYDGVLAVAPGLHARPPVLPPIENAAPPPPNGYDLVLHVGVAGRGPLRIERISHKLGYNMKDAKGCHAPTVHVARDEVMRGPSQRASAERMERVRLGYDIDGPIESSDPPKRGFGKGYELFPEEIHTEVDVEKLVNHLKKVGVEQVYSSLDAGHYLCDFIYYCSLAESRRFTPKTDKPFTKVLFIHCPPVDQPLSTEEVTEAIRKTIIWLCSSYS
ncbi:hypothetical protein JVU11DRAFT_2585 [Chiua virens]|nr:hypothetical protein JVU11DRAFT_2585 [Chiua virens]